MGATAKTLHLVVHGRVQGVCYRDSMRREAERLGVNGWVRNRRDGTVEALAQGEADAVDALVRWAQRGPQLAAVTCVELRPGNGNYAVFEIRESV
ncbi:MAG: acylphosphatase [Sideroxydans sp.]